MKKQIKRIIKSDPAQIFKENKSFCAAPWVHTHVWPDGRVYPCCMSNPDVPLDDIKKHNNFEDIWNGPTYSKLREDMLNGTTRPDICSRCYDQEDHDVKSLRFDVTKKHWQTLIYNLKETNLVYKSPLRLSYWDYRFNNLCNLSCRTCGPDLSSSWYNDHVKLFGVKPKYATEKFVKFNPKENGSLHKDLVENQIQHVEEVYFAGGEPLIMDEHLDVVKQLLDQKRTDVLLRYSTNLTTTSYKQTEFLEVWPKFQEVLVMISLDEIFDRAEYWRNGTNWKKLELNIKRLWNLSQTQKNVKIGYAPTISIFNVHRIDVYLEYLLDNNLLDEQTSFSYNILQNPMMYNIKILPIEYKKLALKSIERAEKLVGHWEKHQPGLSSIKSYLKEDIINNTEFLELGAEFFAHIDKCRNQNLKTIAPEIYELYTKYNYDIYYADFKEQKINEK